MKFFQDLEDLNLIDYQDKKMANQPNIPIDESQYQYGDFDNVFFPAGKTPKYIYISFCEIKIGELYADSGLTSPPPQGTYKCTQFDNTNWRYNNGNLDILFNFSSGKFRIIASYVLGEDYAVIFNVKVGAWPYLSDENRLSTFEGNYFYGGFFMATWIPPEVPLPISIVADYFGLEPDKKTFYQGFAKSSTAARYRYARKKDATNIKITLDKSTS
jgi:hypothetical protein